MHFQRLLSLRIITVKSFKWLPKTFPSFTLSGGVDLPFYDEFYWDFSAFPFVLPFYVYSFHGLPVPNATSKINTISCGSGTPRK